MSWEHWQALLGGLALLAGMTFGVILGGFVILCFLIALVRMLGLAWRNEL